MKSPIFVCMMVFVTMVSCKSEAKKDKHDACRATYLSVKPKIEPHLVAAEAALSSWDLVALSAAAGDAKRVWDQSFSTTNGCNSVLEDDDFNIDFHERLQNYVSLADGLPRLAALEANASTDPLPALVRTLRAARDVAARLGGPPLLMQIGDRYEQVEQQFQAALKRDSSIQAREDVTGGGKVVERQGRVSCAEAIDHLIGAYGNLETTAGLLEENGCGTPTPEGLFIPNEFLSERCLAVWDAQRTNAKIAVVLEDEKRKACGE